MLPTSPALSDPPEAEPFECRWTTRNLAELYFVQEAWEAALRTYRSAIDVGERLYQVGLTITSKTAEVSENSALYSYAAFAAVRCGKTTEALLLLERGKTRLLTEALHLRVRRPLRIPDPIWNAFEQARSAVRAEQAAKPFTLAGERDPVQAYEAYVQAVQAAHATLDSAIKRVRSFAPDFLAALDFSTIQAQLSEAQIALVSFCITEQGSIGFIVSQHSQVEVKVVEIPAFTRADLRHLFVEWDADEQPTGGWLGAYTRYLTDPSESAWEAWQTTMTRVLAVLGERLLTPLLSQLSAQIKHLILLPSAELFLFPLHAAPFTPNTSELISDRYQVSYAPSIEVLADTRAKVMQEMVPTLYAVINPQNDPNLLFTQSKEMAIAQLFGGVNVTIDTGPNGTKKRVSAGMQGRTYVHFSCHGSYTWTDPPASGLELADARLTLAELQQGEIDLSSARLLTLSACETGIIDVLRGSAEEYVGIPAGFLLAGVPCVVSSLWSVPDLSTALLMERFYRNHLKNNMEIAAALREAQRWVRAVNIGVVAAYAEQCYRQSDQTHSPQLFYSIRHYRSLAKQHPDMCPFEHPYYWAAFTVNGW